MYGWLLIGALAAQTVAEAPEATVEGLEQLYDASGHLDFAAVSATTSAELDFRPVSEGIFSAPPGVLWVRLRLVSQVPSRHYVHLDWPRLDDVRLFTVVDDEVSEARSGANVSFMERPEYDRAIAFPVETRPAPGTQVFLRITTRSGLRAPLEVLSTSTYGKRRSVETLSAGLFAGAVLALSMFSLLVFVRLRRPMYVFFALHMLGFLGWWLLARGWGGALDLDARWALLGFTACFNLWLFARLAFTRALLGLEALAPDWDRSLFRVQYIALPLLFAAQLAAPSRAQLMAFVAPLFLLGLELSAGLVARRRRHPLASWYLVATGALLGGLLLGSFALLGRAEISLPLSRAAIQVGVLGELFGLAFLLAESIREVTRERQRALRQVEVERLGALQGLVAGVTHELNTPLGALVSSAQSLETVGERLAALEGKGDKRSDRALRALPSLTRAAMTGAGRISEVVQSLKLFAQLDEAEQQLYDLHEGLDSAIALLGPKLGEGIRFETRYEGPRQVPCRPAAINQVCMSILENAVQAVEGDGRIEVRTSGQSSFRLEVEDDGIGMSPEQVSSAFTPRLSAPGARVKMGMGLSAARGIVEQAGGRIELRSTPGRGTTVTVELPAASTE